MAETPAPEPSHGGSDRFGFLTRKLGPLPVWAYAAILVGVYYWYTHYGPGKSTSTTPTTAPYGVDANGNPIIPTATESINQSGGPDSSSTTITSTSSGGEEGRPNPKTKPKRPVQPHPARYSRRPPHASPGATDAPDYVTVAKWPGKGSNGLAQWNTTLWGIAQHEHTTVPELQKLNPQVKNPNLVYPGEHIVIPDTDSSGHPRPSHTNRRIPSGTAPSQSTEETQKKVMTQTVNTGRWQNQEKISIPITGQTQPSQDQTGNQVTDIIEHRPLGA